MRKVANRNVSGFGWGIAHEGRYAMPADFPLHDGTGGYAYDVGVWDMSIVQVCRAKP
jgi:hypothetical protein